MEHLYEVNPGRSLMLPEKFGQMKDRIWAITGDYVSLEDPTLRGWMRGQMGKLTKRRILPKGKSVVTPQHPAALRAMAAASGSVAKTPAVEKAEAIVEDVVDAEEPPAVVPPPKPKAAPKAPKAEKKEFGK